MKKLFFVLLACALMIAPQLVQAQTAVGTLITNEVLVEGLNFTTANASIVTQVSLIAGADFPTADTDITGAIGNQLCTNDSVLNNLGNGPITFNLVIDQETNGACGGIWTYDVLTNGDAYLTGVSDDQTGGGITLASGGNVNVSIIATADLLLATGFNSFQISATTADPVINSGRYVGDNGTTYGGPVTTGWGEFAADEVAMYGTGVADGSTEEVWRITGAGAVTIAISKTIASISDPAGYGSAIVVPGSTITYNIRVTNSGLGVGQGVVVKDTVDLANLTMGDMSVAAGSEANWAQMTNGNVVIWSNTDLGGQVEGGNWADLQFTAIVQ